MGRVLKKRFQSSTSDHMVTYLCLSLLFLYFKKNLSIHFFLSK